MKKRSFILFWLIVWVMITAVTGSCSTGISSRKQQEEETERKQAEIAVANFMSKLPAALQNGGDKEVLAYFDRNEGFSDLSQDGIDCVIAALKKFNYSISETTLENDGESAQCLLIITDVDPKSVLDGFTDPRIPADKLIELISAEDASLRTSDCPISLVKNDVSHDWEISEADKVIDHLIGHYVTPDYVPTDPVDGLLRFTKALADGKVFENDYYLAGPAKWEYLYPDDSLPKFETAFFAATRFEVIDVSYDGEECFIETTIDYPDVYYVNTLLAQDREILMSMHRAGIISYLTGDLVDLSETDRLSGKKGADLLLDPDIPRSTVQQSFRLVLSSSGKTWMVSGLPEVLTEKNYDFDKGQDKDNIAAFYQALLQMLDNQEIDNKTYTEILRLTGLDPVNTEITGDILSQGWVDVNTEQPVSDYIASESNGIMYLVTFRSAWPETKIYGTYYLDGDPRPIHEFERILKSDTTFSTCLVGTDSMTIPTGSYQIVLWLVDGTILVSAEVEVR